MWVSVLDKSGRSTSVPNYMLRVNEYILNRDTKMSFLSLLV